MLEPKHLRLLRPFVLLALCAGALGTGLGFVILEQAQWLLQGVRWSWRQLHGQLQLFGFLIPFVTGFALYLVPRLAGGRPVQHRLLARVSLGTQAAAIVLVGAAALIDPASAALRAAAALCECVGLCGAAFALRRPIAEHARAVGGRSRLGYLWLFEGALWFLAAAGAADGLALWLGAWRAEGFLDGRWAAAAQRLGLEGFAVGMALGVSARMFTGFLGIDPSRAYPSPGSAYFRRRGDAPLFFGAVAAWAASVPIGAVGELAVSGVLVQVADLLFALGVVPLALRLGLGRAQETLPIDRSQDPAFAFGARGAFALLVLGASIGAVAGGLGLAGFLIAPEWADARRHALTIGFLLGLIATMAGRLAPGYAGRRLFAPALRVTAIASFLLAGTLRSFEGAAAQWGMPGLLSVSALSGPLALLGFCALVVTMVATLLTAPRAH